MNLVNKTSIDEDELDTKYLSVSEVVELLEVIAQAEDRADTSLSQVDEDSAFWSMEVDGESPTSFIENRATIREMEDGYEVDEEWAQLVHEINLTPDEVRDRLDKYSRLGRPSKVDQWVERIADEDDDATIQDAVMEVSPSTVYKIKNRLKELGYLDEEEDEEEQEAEA